VAYRRGGEGCCVAVEELGDYKMRILVYSFSATKRGLKLTAGIYTLDSRFRRWFICGISARKSIAREEGGMPSP
jgi:hypothetical protein